MVNEDDASDEIDLAQTGENVPANQMTVEQWLAIRKEAAPKIDPETAEVMWCYGQILDPYGVKPDLPEECDQVGRTYFARASENDVWVSFDDLSETTASALWKRLMSE